jgi:glycosyltransferase involved in cell wall biosynthesis
MTHQPPRYSIVLPVRNGSRYLAETLDSLFAQTYPHFDILVLENHSTDDTAAILASRAHPRLRVFPSDRPLSIEDNWRRILDLPLAEWMTIISHDDLLYPNFLSEMAALQEAHPDATIYTAHFDLINPDGSLLRPCRPIPAHQSAEAFLWLRQHYALDSFGTGYVTRSESFRRVGGMPALPQLYYADDLLVYSLSQLGSKIASPKSLFAYRYHRRSASYVIPLQALYRASKSYLEVLERTGYLSVPTQARAARHYIEKTINRRYHRYLVDLILTNESGQIEDYWKTREQLLSWSRADGKFDVLDPVSRAAECILAVPVPPLRRLLARMAEICGILTRRIRK